MAAEATYFGGSKVGESNPTATQYPTFNLKSSWGGAFKFGFEF
jgi:hypothetical protein